MAKAAYSIVLWLNVPGSQAREAEEANYLSERGDTPGAQSHVFNAPAATRLVYGSYETHEAAVSALTDLESQLARDQAVHVGSKDDDGGALYLVPAKSIYYAVLGTTQHTE